MLQINILSQKTLGNMYFSNFPRLSIIKMHGLIIGRLNIKPFPKTEIVEDLLKNVVKHCHKKCVINLTQN